MNNTYTSSLFIFHRDLRLNDNTTLLAALKSSKSVSLCFIFDTRQIDNKTNKYHSSPAVQFMLESLTDLEAQITATTQSGSLSYLYGTSHDVVAHILATTPIEAVYSNYDYTPFAEKRDGDIRKVCETANIPFHQYHDALLHAPGDILKDDGTPYTVYTPFAKKARLTKKVLTPELNTETHYTTTLLPDSIQKDVIFSKVLKQVNLQLKVKGGRSSACDILAEITDFRKYKEQRDIPALDATTHLSAHNKFGTVSIREVYHVVSDAFGAGHTLISELYWRDFFTHIGYHFPNVFAGNFKEAYDALEWDTDTKAFTHWCNGTTGFPIVDAGMRELNTTGYMHNRVRMIVASFLTKDLHIDWRKGERYFANTLTDYDPAVNNGNWQWAASTGCDAQPYFRIFNPWLQQKRFDPDALYIKTWLPELQDIPAKDIMKWNSKFEQYTDTIAYPAPIVDHSEERKETLKRFKQAKK